MWIPNGHLLCCFVSTKAGEELILIKMKKYLLIFAMVFAFLYTARSQSGYVVISGPEKVEVGFEYKYYADFTPDSAVDYDEKVNYYKWSVGDNGVGKAGISEIYGDMDFTGINPVWHDWADDTLLHHSDSIIIVWGDFDNTNTDDRVHVNLEYKTHNASYPTVQKDKFFPDEGNIRIYRVWKPNFDAPVSVQACCQNEIEIVAKDFKDADIFEWEIVSGGVISHEDENKVTVIPDIGYEDIELWCRVSRASGREDYYRENNVIIEKHTPKTPPIKGPTGLCKGETYEFCVDSFCGMSGNNWTIPSSLDIISGQGTNCIKVTPNLSAEAGVSVDIKAGAIMEGGCVSIESSKDVTIFSSEIPPEPEGYVFLEDLFPNEGEIDPCDEAHFYKVKFIATKQYKNGYTIILPQTVIDVPHHHLDDRIEVTVCNYNICSGVKKCKTFIVYLPDCPPEDDWDKIVINNQGIQTKNHTDIAKETKAISQISAIGNKENEGIQIYPNPFNNTLILSFPQIGQGEIELFTMEGRKVYSKRIENKNTIRINNISEFKSGIYILKLNSANYTTIRKIIKNN